jgi:hypothetical protein
MTRGKNGARLGVPDSFESYSASILGYGTDHVDDLPHLDLKGISRSIDFMRAREHIQFPVSIRVD